jgi:hypothetical protein
MAGGWAWSGARLVALWQDSASPRRTAAGQTQGLGGFSDQLSERQALREECCRSKESERALG